MLVWLIGLVSGIIGGMGIGGGSVLVPGLVFLLGTEQHVAQGVTLVTFLPMAAVALFIHYRAGNLKLRPAWPLIVGSVVSAFIGARLAAVISGPMLKKIFALFLFGVGLYEFWSGMKKGER